MATQIEDISHAEFFKDVPAVDEEEDEHLKQEEEEECDHLLDTSVPAEADASKLQWRLRPDIIFYIGLAHVVAVVGLVLAVRLQPKLLTYVWSVVCYVAAGFGITAGAHRYWSHRSYKCTTSFRYLLMILCSMANQGTIYHWVRDHRQHHKYSETAKDPHNASYGFGFSHIGWLMYQKPQPVLEAGKKVNMSDLEADSAVMFQKRLGVPFNTVVCFVLPSLVPMLWGEGYWTALCMSALRYILVLHGTFLVNSWAHIYGDRPYDPTIGPAESIVVSVAAVGEGWHNWHHKFPFDYAASEFGISTQWNPTKLFLDTAAKLGFVYDRRRATWKGRKQH